MTVQSLADKKSNFITRCKDVTMDFLTQYEKLKAIKQEWISEGFSGTIVQDDIVGNSIHHLTPTILGNLMNTFDVIESLINSNTQDIDGSVGYLTNLYNVKG